MLEKKFERGQLGKYSLEEKNELGKLWKILKHEKTVFIYINIFLSDPTQPGHLELQSIAIVTAVSSVFSKG